MPKRTADTGIENVRHSLAHLLAAAVLKKFPKAKLGIGPTIEDGFYYDFEVSRGFTPEDLKDFEGEMKRMIAEKLPFNGKKIAAAEARKMFRGQPYKLELIKDFVKEKKQLTVYAIESGGPRKSASAPRASAIFIDLCRGGHVKNTSEINPDAFKITSTAGAYWKGDEKNPQLQRIYGVAFKTKKELEEHLKQLEEAKKRDHRKLGQELDLFTIREEVGPGLILWMPKGNILKEELERLGRETEKEWGYERISTPHIAKKKLYEISGHLPYYKNDMYPEMKYEGGEYYLKPMNCPFAHLIYASRKHSYKELPIRYAEYGTVYRNEDSGTLLGLLRVRGLTQNDAHIYCTEGQALDEVLNVMKLHEHYYDLLGIEDYYIELALPDFKKKKDKYFDDQKAWGRAVEILRMAAKKSGLSVIEKEGEAAFYGPKFDFNIESVTGREFGASTNQLDFGSGKRFGLTYTERNGKEKTVPYIIHRAPLGSTERFAGFLIEHYGGAFPTWLAPVQVQILPVSQKQEAYGEKILKELADSGVRAELTESDETLGKRIREGETQKIPYLLVVGEKEVEAGLVAIRKRGKGDLGTKKVTSFTRDITKEIKERR